MASLMMAANRAGPSAPASHTPGGAEVKAMIAAAKSGAT
jgi:hypothetical protein